jgi:hypothetical protein
MYDVLILTPDGDKYKLVMPHRCGSVFIENLINDNCFDVEVLGVSVTINPLDDYGIPAIDRTVKCVAYGRNPYKRIISSFIENSHLYNVPLNTSKSQVISSFRNFIKKTKSVWEEHGDWYQTLPNQLPLVKYWDHFQPTYNDVMNALSWDTRVECQHLKLEHIKDNFPLKKYWRSNNDITWEEITSNYYSQRNTRKNHELYHISKYPGNMSTNQFYDNYIIKLVNEMFEKDFKMFEYDVFNDVKQIEEMDNE